MVGPPNICADTNRGPQTPWDQEKAEKRKRRKRPPKKVEGDIDIDHVHEGQIADAARKIASWQGSTKANIYKVAKREIFRLLGEVR